MTSDIVRKHIPEQRIPGFPLGRHILHDPRSWNHRAITAPKLVTTSHESRGLPLSQGAVGKCTAEAGVAAVNTIPNWITGGPVRTDLDSDNLYEKETTDQGAPWGGQSNPSLNDTGGSGLAVSKAMVEMGWISHYTHTFSLNDMLAALVLRGGMIGSYWFDSMDHPDPHGVVSVSPDAAVRGGHEYYAYLIDVEQQLVGCWNSWGLDWGRYGKFAMSWDTVDFLLSQQGDFTVPVV